MTRSIREQQSAYTGRASLLVLAIISLAFVSSCGTGNDDLKPTSTNTRSAASTDHPRITPTEAPDPLDSMSLEDKVGQMLMFTYPGTTVNETVRTLVEEWRIGGLVLLGPNVAGPRPLSDFVSEVQALSQENTGRGLLLAIDQEGGLVLRLNEFFTPFPSAEAVGATGDPGLARELAKAMGEEMRAVGLNMNLAPVLDVAGHPISPPIETRSFGEDPTLVSQMGTAYVQGLHDAGIIATGKHFPGHGSAPADSHAILPIDERDADTIRATDIAPYRESISAGIDVVMTAHVAYPALNENEIQPGTVSPRIVDGLLRQELGFDGVVITDSMTMGAITDSYDIGEAAVLAVLAGADIILMTGDLGTQGHVRQALLTAAEDGRLSMERIDQSVSRILRLKEMYGVGSPHEYDPDAIGSAEHAAVADRVRAGGG